MKSSNVVRDMRIHIENKLTKYSLHSLGVPTSTLDKETFFDDKDVWEFYVFLKEVYYFLKLSRVVDNLLKHYVKQPHHSRRKRRIFRNIQNSTWKIRTKNERNCRTKRQFQRRSSVRAKKPVPCKLKNGENIPTNIASAVERKKYIRNNFIPPISFRQFSNATDRRGKLYDLLVKRNGTEDPI